MRTCLRNHDCGHPKFEQINHNLYINEGVMELLEFYINLRRDVLEQISGVKDSNGYFSWDSTTPNYLIKSRLEYLFEQYTMEARTFGIYVVTRYANCAHKGHDGYPVSNKYGLEINYQDAQFLWGAGQLYQGPRISTCPCSPKNKPSINHVIDEIIYTKSSNMDDCKIISATLCDIHEAIENATEKKARSGIREHLLRAILRLNDAILPMTVEEYIATTIHENK